MEKISAHTEKKWMKRVLIAVAGLLVLYTLFGFVILPLILRSVLVEQISSLTKRRAFVETVDVNPYALTIGIRELKLEDLNANPFVAFDELFVDFELIASAFNRAIVFKEVRLAKPDIHIVRTGASTFNFSDLIPADAPEDEKKPADGSKTVRLAVDKISLTKGAVQFSDRHAGVDHQADDVSITVSGISTLPQDARTEATLGLKAILNGSPIKLNAQGLFFDPSLRTRIYADIRKLDLLRCLPYVALPKNLKVPSAFSSAKIALDFSRQNDQLFLTALTGWLEVSEARVTLSENQPLFYVPELEAKLNQSDLLKGPYHIDYFRINRPEIHIRRNESGNLELASLAGEKAQTTASEKDHSKTAEPVVDLDDFSISGAVVAFSDSAASEPFQTRLEDMKVSVKNFSTRKDRNAEYAFSARTDANETVESAGRFCLDPLSAQGAADLANFVLKRYAPYYQDRLGFEITGGTAGAHAGFRFESASETLALDGVGLDLKGLSIQDRVQKRTVLKIDEFSVSDTQIDATHGSVVLGMVASRGGNAFFQRNADGAINWQRLVVSDQKAIPEKAAATESPSWKVLLNQADLSGWSVEFEDLAPDDPVKLNLSDIAVKAGNLGTAVEDAGKADLSLLWNRTGSIGVKGEIRLKPLQANLGIDAKGLDLRSVQPYFSDQVNILITDGTCGAKGRLKIAQNAARDMAAEYDGDLFLNKFSSVDREFSQDFFKCGSLYISKARIGYNPTKVSIGDVALTDFFSRLIVHSSGKINLQSLMAEKEAAAPKTEEKAAPVPVHIDTVTLQGGSIKFSDYYVEPNFDATLLEIGGRISGLASEENRRADVLLKGRLSNYAPLEITGTINPLAEELFADIVFSFKQIQLSPFTPYSGKYLGYQLQKGQLDLSLEYKIDQGKLRGKNRVRIDQLTLGDSVKSPSATSLPVKLAIALLKDRNGVIDLDLPVQGDLKDPKFRIGKVVIAVLVNLVTKAVTAPFALLGSMFGGGADLSYVEFDYGSSEPGPEALKKLADLENALYQRPALSLEIQGQVDPDQDREALRQLAFEERIKAEKLKDVAKKQPNLDLSDIAVSLEERPLYVEKAYKAGQFPKPRGSEGLFKKLPVEEMEKLLFTHTLIADNDLRQLAYQRAEAVRNHIMKNGKVTQNRMFILEPEPIAKQETSKNGKNRVRFSLR